MGEITVDPKGVLKLSNTLNIHKASGPDGLSARVLKECSSEISPMLALIYNESLAQGTVPDDWRQANVAPVFKKGEKYNAANYRQPVSHQPGGSRTPVYKHIFGEVRAAALRPSYVSQGSMAVATSYGEFSTRSFSFRFLSDVGKSEGSHKAASR